MSFNSDGSTPSTSSSAAAGTTRDWIFPSYSFVHSPQKIHKTPRRRRFSSYQPPPAKFNSATASFQPQTVGDSNSTISSVSRLRPRRFEFGNYEKSTRLLDDGLDGGEPSRIKPNEAVTSERREVKERTAPESTFSGFLGSRLRVRWQLALTVAVSFLLFSLSMCELMCLWVIGNGTTVDVLQHIFAQIANASYVSCVCVCGCI